jgi:protein transport protein SEC61 subunit gamma and related proteins
MNLKQIPGILKDSLSGIFSGLRMFIQQCRRVLMVATKPDKEEFKLSSKITGIGLVVIGIIGFVLFMIFQLTGMS